MIAFHNDPAVKDKYLARVLAHQKADELIKGKYWQNGKGCAVGCTIHSSAHANYEAELGIPEWLARVEDKIFEGLPNDRAQLWPAEFLSAINIGADLEKTKAPFMIFVCEFALEQFDHQKFPACKKAVEGVIDLWRLPQQQRTDAAMGATADAAYAAYATDAADAAYAAYAAYAAATDAAAADAAYAALGAANAAANAAYAAAYAAANAAANAATRAAAYVKFANKLLEILRDCR